MNEAEILRDTAALADLPSFRDLMSRCWAEVERMEKVTFGAAADTSTDAVRALHFRWAGARDIMELIELTLTDAKMFMEREDG